VRWGKVLELNLFLDFVRIIFCLTHFLGLISQTKSKSNIPTFDGSQSSSIWIVRITRVEHTTCAHHNWKIKVFVFWSYFGHYPVTDFDPEFESELWTSIWTTHRLECWEGTQLVRLFVKKKNTLYLRTWAYTTHCAVGADDCNHIIVIIQLMLSVLQWPSCIE
jgi:hypothetical protein